MSEQDRLTDLNSRIDKIEVTLTHAVDAIEQMSKIVNRPQETKWGPIIAALGLLAAAATGYTTLITLPIEREIADLQEADRFQYEMELGRERDIGRIEGRMGIIDE